MEIIDFKEIHLSLLKQTWEGYVIQLRIFRDDLHFCADHEQIQDLVLEYSEREVYALISSGHLCCESFGFGTELPHQSTQEPIPEHISQIEPYEVDEYLIGKRVDYIRWDTDRNNSCASISIGNVVKILLYNYHNGYYPHDLYLTKGDETVDFESI